MLSLSQIRNFYPGASQDTQTSIHLLKEYIELMTLNFLSSSKYIGKLSFIGGTNLRLVKGIDRFSEDLDFDCKNLGNEEFMTMTDDVIRFLQRSGLPAVAKDKESDKLSAMRRTISFPEYLFSIGLASQAERDRKFILKIEAQDQGIEYERVNSTIISDGFHFQFPTPSDSTLCAMKCATVLSRGKGRDFYDTLFLLQLAQPDYEYLEAHNGIKDSAMLKEAMLSRLSAIDLSMKAKDFKFLAFDADKASIILNFKESFLQLLQ